MTGIRDIVTGWSRTVNNPATLYEYQKHINGLIKEENIKTGKDITRSTISDYVMSRKTYASRAVALASCRSLMYYIDPEKIIKIKIGEAPAPEEKEELSDESLAKIIDVVDKWSDEPNLPAKIAILLLVESGHRRRAVGYLPRDAVSMGKDGATITFPPSGEKRGATSIVPISEKLYNMIMKHLEQHGDKYLIHIPKSWEARERWVYYQVKVAGKLAGVDVHPHSFRYKKARTFRRAGVDTDIAINILGWKDSKQYDSRYGRRNQHETAELARSFVNGSEPAPQAHNTPVIAPTTPGIMVESEQSRNINRLMDLREKNAITEDSFNKCMELIMHKETNTLLVQ
jgi:integrase